MPSLSKAAVVLLLTASILYPSSASAQRDAAGRPAGSTGPTWSLGLGVISAPRPYVGASSSIQPIPLVEFYSSSGRWFAQGIRGGYRVVDTETIDFDLRLRFRFSGLDPEDSPFLTGMEKRQETVEAGVGFGWTVGESLGGTFGLELRAFADVLGRSDGAEASVDLSWRKVFGPGRVMLVPALGMVYQNANQVDYYYGVRPEEARPGRPAYAGQAVFNPRASLLLLYRFSRHWALTTLVSADFFDTEITDSPIVDRDAAVFGLVGATYRF